ncbi:UDP-forming cellulose synthase catalytic subunit [Paludibacterium yongneupense]|uniref:UDP-forming cellulose synthase catalytic subunit n=1 Tax=Paludibacterium yongneupense TaxID=400061 RepID=UPI000400FFBF|nr:UDP-forming cellulose synthase catalytic subunit [Paludibacterium yongneupense]
MFALQSRVACALRFALKRRSTLLCAWFCCLGLLLFLASVPLSLSIQIQFGWGVVALLLVLRLTGAARRWRLFFLLLCCQLTLRYVYWRTTSTLGYNGPFDLLAAVLLYLAELYGIVVALLGIFVNVAPVRREPVPLPADRSQWPTVDILIPSYNEPLDMLDITLRAALNIRYPRDRFHVYLLDDGGTVQKRAQADPLKAAEAWSRHRALQELTARLGARYLTRERNEHAKAGNINAALAHVSSDLVAILDADHVPTVDFLEKTTGFFLADEKMFLVQTPHFFINPDPVEKNLQMFGQMPSESEMFYSVIQPGLDFWNAAFFCGSAAILRRRCLDEVGGIQGNSITEDAETALELHARGYHSAFLGIPLISGLQPETFTAFVVQRVRWAQGMIQIFLLKNPLLQPGLKIWQRLCYFSSSFFWFFGYARMVFLLAPLAYLLFGLQIYNASFTEVLAYGFPHVVGVMLMSDLLFGEVRWAFISELYELMQAFFALPGILQVLRNPRAPTFNVTPKGEQLDTDFISRLAGPFYLVYLLVLIGVGFAAWRFFAYPLHRDITLVTLGWNLFNLLLLNAAMGALFERRQRRQFPRMPVDLDARLTVDAPGECCACRVDDLSMHGALVLGSLATPLTSGARGRISIFDTVSQEWLELSVLVRSSRPAEKGGLAIGVQFINETQEQISRIALLMYGDSRRWQSYREERKQRIGFMRSFGLLILLGGRYAFAHYRSIAQQAARYAFDLLLYYSLPWRRALGRFWRKCCRWVLDEQDVSRDSVKS